MTFLHAALLGGVAAIVVPIVLHLIMRKQPQHLEFPALRFIKQRENANKRRMQFRHWLLLALRCALLTLLAVALARPSIVASGVLGDQEAPVAAALVFDTNPRMQYRQQNQTRLEVAQETGTWLLEQLPNDSDVAVVDSRTASAAFAVDRGAARQRIERLDAGAMSPPLGQALDAALKLVAESDKQRKELYIFSDLSRGAWARENISDLTERLRAVQDVGVYLIDVGAKDPSNLGFGQVRLSSQTLAQNAPLLIQADLVRVGPTEERSVELVLLAERGKSQEVRGRKTAPAGDGGTQRLEFQLRGLGQGLHQGLLKIGGEDALACDDAHYFTVAVRPAWKVLIAAPGDQVRPAQEYALFLSEALSPHALRVKGEAAFEVEVINTAQLGEQDLEQFGAVCLVDPRPLTPATWQKLQAYVVGGGGLGVFLGRNAVPTDSFNEPIAQELLPGKLLRQWRASEELHLAPENFDHPVLRKFRGLETAWELVPFFRHWQLSDMSQDAAPVIAFSNNQPAVVDRPVGKGRVITVTSSVSDAASRPGVRGYEPWNLLPTGDDRFVFFLLANTIVEYLVGAGTEQLNYTAGDVAVVPLEADARAPFLVLTTPRGDQLRISADERQESIAVTSTEVPGNYQLQSGGGKEAIDLGFSVNLPPGVSQLQPVSQEDLQAIFGETPFRLAHNRDEIDRSVSAARTGQELFPLLMILVVLVLAAEQVISNRFYQDYDTRAKQSRAAELAGDKAQLRGARPAEVPVR